MNNLKIYLLFLFTGITLSIASSASGQWVQTNGLYGGYIQALIVSGSNLFAGTEKDGILRSSDNGVSWNSASTGLPASAEVDAFAVSGTNIYAGTLSDGVFLSTDKGMNWTTLGFTDVSSLAMSGMNLIIGTNSGVAVLTDNGNKWVSDGLINKSINTLAVIGSIFFAGTTTGVFLSTDSGKTWTTADSGLVQHGDTLYVNTLTASGTDLFAAAGGGVFRSTDVGKSWFAVDTGLPSFIGITSFALSGANLFVGSEEGWVFRSTDKGTSWSVADTGLPTYTNKTSLAVSGAILFAGTQSNGLFVSTDNGSNWSITSIGLFNTSGVTSGQLGNQGVVLNTGDTNIGVSGIHHGYSTEVTCHTYQYQMFPHGKSSPIHYLPATSRLGLGYTVFGATKFPSSVKSSGVAKNQFTVWPSIASASFNVALDNSENASQFVLIDPIGRVVFEQSVSPGIDHFEVASSELPSGIYLCQLITETGNEEAKIIVRH